MVQVQKKDDVNRSTNGSMVPNWISASQPNPYNYHLHATHPYRPRGILKGETGKQSAKCVILDEEE